MLRRSWRSVTGAVRTRAYALHVGGLNHRQNADFVDEMRAAELVYADGGSIGAAGQARRCTSRPADADDRHGMGRAPRPSGERLGRPARLALIGGPPGLANRAGAALEDGAAGMVVSSSPHGFQDDWEPVLDRLVAADADVCLVGMGAPREMLWVQDVVSAVCRTTLVLTCGGWFGFLAGDERRAGALLRRSGLEWIARVAQSPRRLGGRYARGAVSTGVVAAQTLGVGGGDERKPSSPHSAFCLVAITACGNLPGGYVEPTQSARATYPIAPSCLPLRRAARLRQRGSAGHDGGPTRERTQPRGRRWTDRPGAERQRNKRLAIPSLLT